jgi:ornithine cyclodeaminase
MTSVLVVGHDDTRELLPMATCIELMADALAALQRGEAANPLRSVLRPPEGAEGLLGVMPAWNGNFGLKAVGVFPENSQRGLDPHQGVVVLFSGETGEVEGLVNAAAITAIRTAAVSAVATRLLARTDARVLGILGAGVQARSHVEAMSEAMKPEQIVAWSPTPERLSALVSELPAVTAAPSAEEVVRAADVLCTTTNARKPVVRRDWVKPGTHVNAVGSSIATTRELDTETIAAASLYVDRRESTVNEAGDYLFPLQEGAIGPEHIKAELGELLTGEADGRSSDDEITVFKSLGLAVEDLAAVSYVLRRARELGRGTQVDL